jgi:hypothetical protein
VAKKKGSIGVISLEKNTPKKRPGRHSKSYSKKSHEEKNLEDKVANGTS